MSPCAAFSFLRRKSTQYCDVWISEVWGDLIHTPFKDRGGTTSFCFFWALVLRSFCFKDTLHYSQCFKLSKSSLLLVEGSRATGTSEQTNPFCRHTHTHTQVSWAHVWRTKDSHKHTHMCWKNTTTLTTTTTSAASGSIWCTHAHTRACTHEGNTLSNSCWHVNQLWHSMQSTLTSYTLLLSCHLFLSMDQTAQEVWWCDCSHSLKTHTDTHF